MPFLRVGLSANPFVFNERGEVLIWDHETNRANPAELTFIEIFQQELKQLKEKKNKIKSNPELFQWQA